MKYWQLTPDWGAGGLLRCKDFRDLSGEVVDDANLEGFSAYLGHDGGVKNTRVPEQLQCSIIDGAIHDWNWGRGSSVPLIRSSAADRLLRVAGSDIELIPLQIDHVDERFFVVNILSRIDCVDETRAFVKRLTAEDRVHPEFIGRCTAVMRLAIDSIRAGHANLFRILNYESAIVASTAFVEAASLNLWSGIAFTPTYEGPPHSAAERHRAFPRSPMGRQKKR